MLEDKQLSKHFINHSCMGNANMVSLLSEMGHLKTWLNSDDESQINQAIHLLSSVSDSNPDTVVSEIQPFVGLSNEWNMRCGQVLNWNMADDSDAMFGIRKNLLGLGVYPRMVDLEELANKHPKRALAMLEYTFDENISALTKDSYFESDFVDKVNLLSSKVVEDTQNLVASMPIELLQLLLAKIDLIVQSSNDEDQLMYTWFQCSQFLTDCEQFTSGILRLISDASEQLADESGHSALWNLIVPHMQSQNLLIQHILLSMMMHLDKTYAEPVIEWILLNPQSRLSSGNYNKEPKWLLAGRVIEKLSPHCSDTVFKSLEEVVYFAGVTKRFDIIQLFYKQKKEGCFHSHYWGQLQYFIIPKFDASRVTQKSKQLSEMLHRRFASYSDDDFFQSNRTGGGTVVSPLRQPNKLSDKKWKEILQKRPDDFKSFSMKQISEGVVSEASLYTFSRSLETAVTNQPIRFSKLALTLPKDIEREFVNHIFAGLGKSKKDVHQDYQENWQACSLNLIYQVIKHFGDEPHSNYLAWLLTKNTNVLTHSDLLAMLINMAKHSPSPEFNKLSIYNPNKGDLASIATAHELTNTSINCCRGIAYNGLATLFWEDEKFAIKNKHLIDSAMADKHPAVQVTAIRMLTPFLNTDINFALEKFLEICKQDLRFTCAHQAHEFFNSAFDTDYQDQYVELVTMMLFSEYDDVRKEAGRQVFARWYFNDLFSDIFPCMLKIKQTDKFIRLGFASVLEQFLTRNQYSHLDYKLIEPYKYAIHDQDKEVKNKISSCISQENFWKKTNTKELLACFIDSMNEHTNLHHFCYVLKKRNKHIYPFKFELLSLLNKLIVTSLDNDSFRIRADFEAITFVLNKIYDEAVDDEDEEILKICLDLWDEIFHSNIILRSSNALNQGMLD